MKTHLIKRAPNPGTGMMRGDGRSGVRGGRSRGGRGGRGSRGGRVSRVGRRDSSIPKGTRGGATLLSGGYEK